MTTILLPPFPADLFEAVPYYCHLDMHLFPVKLTTQVEDGKQKLAKKPLGPWRNLSDNDPEFVRALLTSRQGKPWCALTGLA